MECKECGDVKSLGTIGGENGVYEILLAYRKI